MLPPPLRKTNPQRAVNRAGSQPFTSVPKLQVATLHVNFQMHSKPSKFLSKGMCDATRIWPLPGTTLTARGLRNTCIL